MQERLTIVRPPDLGQELASAVSAACATPVRITPDDIPLITARLACGDFETVRKLLHDAPAGPALPLALARYVRWTGDLRTAVASWSRIRDAVATLPEHDAGLQWTTYSELALTATDVGDAQLAARLHRLARSLPVAPATVTSQTAARLIHHVALDLIGLDPDAARGRLRLRPRTDRFAMLHARHIRFGDASLSLCAERDEGGLLIRLEQESGSIPVTVLLEAVVAAGNRAEVDGRPADLMLRPVEGGNLFPVQFVLDHERSLRVRTATP
ncbi:MAG TPA: hypothetical protein VFZ69_04295 [Longimicrobiales bacterium]